MQRYFNREKHLDGICEFLLKNLGMAFCDECLRTALGTYRSVVPERCLSLRNRRVRLPLAGEIPPAGPTARLLPGPTARA
jgi:hypothetical protein